jgi:hypothetical protein
MFEGIFIILTALYALVSVKVDGWITISALGFKSETPMMFIQNPKIYDFVRSILFLGALAISFVTPNMSWITGVISLAVVWLAAGSIGRKKAFAVYRRILREMMAAADTDSDRVEYKEASQKTDHELADMVESSMKYGN